MIEVFDNFLSQEEFNFVLEYCKSCVYVYGEVDNENLPPTGMVHNIPETESIYNLFETKTKELVANLKLYRMYINCFAPSENPYFHTDGSNEEVTFLYYPNETWDLEDAGETQFFIDERLYGILPIPNRLVAFNASLLHKATSFYNRHRFSVAIKYGTGCPD
jgi:Rps23 Pro-64 3,4-dihydroxylase Tpa1-like proline 4-hydroxylase